MVWLWAVDFKAVRGKRVQVPFVLSGPARVTLTVVRGKEVVAEMSATRTQAGRCSLTWDGRINREFAGKGLYKITIQASSPAGTSARETATLRIT
jgi:flagellar hook assembly protein FlgD